MPDEQKHTAEPWTLHPKFPCNVLDSHGLNAIALTRASKAETTYETECANAARIVACVNLLARHPSLPGVITLSAEEAGMVRSLLDKALVEIASTGAPFLNGKYHKGGEWSFAEMTERNNPADADAIKSGFLALKEAADLITRAQKEGQP